MSRRLVLPGAVLCVAATLLFSACTSILGDFEITPAMLVSEAGPPDTGPVTTGAANGTTCQAAKDCASGACSDGVCCEAACTGTCESCKVTGFVGKCMPVPDGQDPDNECPTDPLPSPDAGVQGPVDAGDGGDADAAPVDAGPPIDSGPAFEVPDGGIITNDNQCAGKCNGARACAYPDSKRTCGATVCGNVGQQGRAQCDGKGHCLVGVENCSTYTCPDGSPGCKSTCTSPNDCQGDYFCDGQSNTCKPRLEPGVSCNGALQCKSGYCVDGVCCNTDCTGFEGATCAKPGSVGTCKCKACDTGDCQLFYQDKDNDTFGDKFATVANGRAKPACKGQPPAGFSDNNLDCSDGTGVNDANVRPNQVNPQPGKYIPSAPEAQSGESGDWNCDGATVKQIPEMPGSLCGVCFAKDIFVNPGFSIDPALAFVQCGRTAGTCTSQQEGVQGARDCDCSGVRCPRFGSCVANNIAVFLQDTDCGVTRASYTCGVCSGGSVQNNPPVARKQACL